MTGAAHTTESTTPADTPTAPEAPLFTVTKGDPTPEQLGILTAVFASAAANAEIAGYNPDEGTRNDWGRPAERTRGVFWTSTSSFLNPKFL